MRETIDDFLSRFTTLISEFLKWTILYVNLVRSIVPNRGLSLKSNQLANRVDPNKTAHEDDEPSNQDIHCLQKHCFVLQR